MTTSQTGPTSLLWRESDEYRQLFGEQPQSGAPPKYPRLATVSLTSSGFLLLAAAALQPVASYTTDAGWHTLWRVLQILAVGGAVMWAAGCVAKYFSARMSFLERVRAQKAASVNEALVGLGEDPTIGQLYKLNRRQLDEYHVLSVNQQKLSFQAAQFAAALSFAILLVGAVSVLSRSGSPDELQVYVTGGLSALGALLSGFVARTFYGSYKRTSRQLLRYYREPSRTNFLLSIERLVELAPSESDEERAMQLRVWEGFLTRLCEDFSWVLRHEDDVDERPAERRRQDSPPAAQKPTADKPTADKPAHDDVGGGVAVPRGAVADDPPARSGAGNGATSPSAPALGVRPGAGP